MNVYLRHPVRRYNEVVRRSHTRYLAVLRYTPTHRNVRLQDGGGLLLYNLLYSRKKNRSSLKTKKQKQEKLLQKNLKICNQFLTR